MDAYHLGDNIHLGGANKVLDGGDLLCGEEPLSGKVLLGGDKPFSIDSLLGVDDLLRDDERFCGDDFW